MAQQFVYARGAELPGLNLPWQEQTGTNTWTDLDLSTGYTFTIELVGSDGVDTEPSATVAGYDGGITIDWAVDDLDLDPGVYVLKPRARETATGKDRDWSPRPWPEIRIV